MDYSELVVKCQQYEAEARVKGMAMGAVVLSRMGPIFEKRAVDRFQELAWERVRSLPSITSIDDFDSYHVEFIEAFQDVIKKANGDEAVSYGQAQKPINVFLKSYVDRSGLPDALVAERLRPFLHVPLDSVVIGFFRKEYPDDYRRFIGSVHSELNQWFKERNPSAPKIPDREFSKLQYIWPPIYMAWQRWFREIHPAKPVLLDVVWSMERRAGRRTAAEQDAEV